MKKGVDHIGVTAVFACHDGEGNFLFSKRGTACRDEHGTWDSGGGGVELGDTLEATIRKEIAEEYCTDVLDFEFLGYREVLREHEGQKTHWIAFDFKVLVDPTKAKNGEPHKHDAVEWYRLDALPTPMHSQWDIFYEKYKNRL